MTPLLSIIIPVHNEARRLSVCLEQVIHFMSDHYKGNHEIIVVDNGSTDDTHMIAQCYANTYRTVYALHLPVRGKGIAVKRGMLFARGRFRYMADVDLSTPISSVMRFLRWGNKYDVVIGSRELTLATVTTTPLRRFVGRAFHALVRELAPDIKDTQCGFKLFRDHAARAVFSNLQITGMAFDVEALYLTRLFGYSVTEIPVHWEHNPDSRVRMVWDSLDMARDVISIPWLHMRAKIPA